MIDFNAFRTVANQMVQQGLNESHAIQVQDLETGKLGTYKISSVQVGKEEAARLNEVRAALTAALTSEFGVTSAKQLPRPVRNVLDATLQNGRVMAADITRIVKTLEDRQTAREEISLELCKVVDGVNADISKAMERCGFKGVAIPQKSQLSRALKFVVDDVMGHVKKMTSGPDIRAEMKLLTKKLGERLTRIVSDAFGDEKTPGPLAMSLKRLSESRPISDEDTSDAVIDAINRYVPCREISQIEKKEMADEAKLMLTEFNARLQRLVGDDESNAGKHVSTGVPNGSPIAKEMSEVLKNAKSVDEVRSGMRKITEEWFGTEDEPSNLVKTLAKSVSCGKTIGAQRLLFRYEMMMAGVKDDNGRLLAYNSVCRLALDDSKASLATNARIYENTEEDDEYDFVYESDEPLEELATDPETYRRISWIMNSYKNDVQNMEKLCRYVLNGACKDIEIFDKQLGDRYLTDAEIDNSLNSRSYDIIIGTLEKCRSRLVDDPEFLLYVRQRIGEMPVDMEDGNEVRRLGGWAKNSEYRDELVRMISRLPSDDPFETYVTADNPLRSAEGQRVAANDRYRNLKVDNFRAAFNLAGDGITFKTAAAKTKGHLYLDASGNLKSANRHFGSSVPSSAEDNFLLKLAFIDALRQGGANDKFLAYARRMIGLGAQEQTKPLSRQAVKMVLIDFRNRLDNGMKRDVVPEKVITPQTVAQSETIVTYIGPEDDPWRETYQVTHSDPPSLKERKIEWVQSSLVKGTEVNKEPPKVNKEPPKVNREPPKVYKEPVVKPKSVNGPDPVVNPKPVDNSKPVNNPKPVVNVQSVNKSESAVGPEPQEEQEIIRPSGSVAPGSVDVWHPTGYSDIWRAPADLFKRMILFAKGSESYKNSPLRALDQDGSVVDWIRGSLSGGYLAYLSSIIDECLPGMKGTSITPLCFSTKLYQAIGAAKDSGEKDPVAKFDILATELARSLFSTAGRDPSSRIIGLTQYALTKALVDSLNGERLEVAIREQGGGLVHSDAWSFRENGHTYRSTILPRANVETSMKVSTDRKCHLTGLSCSSLTNADESVRYMTFLRFGEVVLEDYGKGHGADLFQELAEQTFLNNQKLVGNAHDGDVIKLPVVRTDLGGQEKLECNARDFKLTFTPPGAKQPITVTISPQPEHFCLPIDSTHSSTGHLLNKKELELNYAAWKSMRARVEKYDGPEPEKVSMLTEQIDRYFRERLKYTGDASTLKGDAGIWPFENFGAELTRLGARIGALATLLGDVPSVNCRWGRDRTGAMDNEFKLTMINLTGGDELPPIRLPKGAEDPYILQRTRMLESTGNNQIAHQVNLTTHQINLNQLRDSFSDEIGQNHKTSGLASLYDRSRMPKIAMRSESVDSVSLTNDAGRDKDPGQICNELLKNADGVKYRLRRNPGLGHCFFYSALQQMNKEQQTQWGDIASFRKALVDHLEARKRQQAEGKLKGLFKIGNFLYVKTSNGDQPVNDAFFPLIGNNRSEFLNLRKGVNADMSHAAFLADMIKRPVIVISPDTGTSGASMIKFERDLETGEEFDNKEPLIMYYNRYNDYSGHFQAVVKEDPKE